MRHRILVAYALAFLSLALLVWLVRAHLGNLTEIAHMPPGPFLLLVGLYLLGRSFSAESMRLGLSTLGFPLSRAICLMLTLLQSYTNLVVPRSGLAPPAVYLRLQHEVPYASYLAFAVLMILLATGIMGLFGLAAWVGAGFVEAPPLGREIALGFSLIGVTACLAIVAPKKLFGVLPAWPRRHLLAAHDAWERLSSRPILLVQLVALQAGSILLRGVRMKVALDLAGVQLPFSKVMIVSICTDLSMLISLTPAALGFREGGVVFGAALVGVEPGAALVAAVVDRLATTPTIIAAGQLVLWKGLRGYAKTSKS